MRPKLLAATAAFVLGALTLGLGTAAAAGPPTAGASPSGATAVSPDGCVAQAGDEAASATGCPPPTTTTTQPPPTTTTTVPPTTTTTAPPPTTTTTAVSVNPLLSLRAIVNNRFGGKATPADFDLFANGPVRISGVTGNPAVTRALVPPGTYDLSDVQDALAEATDPYTTSGWDCSGSEASTDASVTLTGDEVAVCVVVFSDSPAPATTATTSATSSAPPAQVSSTNRPPSGGAVAPANVTFSPAASTLPLTGANITWLTAGGLVLLAIGWVLILLGRLRRTG